MRCRQTAIIGLVGILLAASGTASIAEAQLAGRAPDPSICSNTATPPQDPLVQGGCIAIERSKGNCDACHVVPGSASGNIGPSLAGAGQRLSKSALRAHVEDQTRFNPQTVMPPYGKHEILTPEEIDKLIAWLSTL